MTDTTASNDTAPINIDYAEVMRRLPHRYPLLLVDKAEKAIAARPK